MRTETIERNIYKFEELTHEAKETALMNFNNSYDYADYDWEVTLKAFCDTFNITLKTWEISTYGGYSYRWNNCGDNYITEVGGYRLSKYLNNNNYYLGKYSKGYVGIEEFCNNWLLTGFWCDYYILSPIVEAYRYKTIFPSYDAMIDACLENFFSEWLEDMEYRESMEYFEELAFNNDWEFLEDGTFFS